MSFEVAKNSIFICELAPALTNISSIAFRAMNGAIGSVLPIVLALFFFAKNVNLKSLSAIVAAVLLALRHVQSPREK